MASGETLFACTGCGKNFKEREDFRQHMRDKHKLDTRGKDSQKAKGTQKTQNAPKPQTTKKAQDAKKPAQKEQQQWCIRCDKSFASQTLMDKHIKSSNMHNICILCPDPSLADFVAPSILQNHLHTTHQACEVCHEVCRSASQLLEHRIKQHSLCLECDRCLITPQQLKTHLTTHAIKDVECQGCDTLFHSDPEMIFHLEKKQCQSGADRDWVVRTALRSPQADEFINHDFGCTFKCPTCQKKFPEMSSMLQHTMDTPNCDEDSDEGPLADFIDYIRYSMDRIQRGTRTTC